MVKRLICFLPVLCCILCGSPELPAQTCSEVVGYYASWKWYKRNKLVNPLTIDYSKYTVINYAFFKPLESGNISEGDEWADKNILLGKLNSRNEHDATSSLVYNAHQNNVKVVASVGGWTWSSSFPGIAADPGKREVFAVSCVALLKKYNLDGIDIDWEFPGSKIHNGTIHDKINFTLLIQAIRNEFSKYELLTGRKFILSAAFGPGPDHLRNIEWESIVPLLDFVHVMSYNYYGAWDRVTNHNAPLKTTKGNPAFTIEGTINALIKNHRVPSHKITLGLAFYGRSVVMQQPGLHQLSAGIPDKENFASDNGTPSYYTIMEKAGLFDYHYDESASSPYMTGKKGINSFISFDDPRSVLTKARYARSMQLGGAVIWDITGDYVETYKGSGIVAGTPLADAIQKAFCQMPGTVETAAISCDADFKAYPNPFRDEIDISLNPECHILKVVVRNESGQEIFVSEKFTDGRLKIITSGWTPGWYIIQLLSVSGTTGERVLKF